MSLRKSIRKLFFSGAALLLLLGLHPEASAQEVARQEVPRDSLLVVARAIIDSTPYCMVATLDEEGGPRVRPMEPFPPDTDMTIWLGTTRYSRKVEDIKRNPTVALSYLAPGGTGYVSVYGTAELVDEQAAKEKWWKPEWSGFYANKDDMYLVIKVTPVRIELIDYRFGITGDDKTYAPMVIRF